MIDIEPTARGIFPFKVKQDHKKIFKVWTDWYFELTLVDIITGWRILKYWKQKRQLRESKNKGVIDEGDLVSSREEMVEPKDPTEVGQIREQVECSHKRSGSAEDKRSKVGWSRGSRGEEWNIPIRKDQEEISCLGMVEGMKTCWKKAWEQSISEQDEVHKERKRGNGDNDYWRSLKSFKDKAQ